MALLRLSLVALVVSTAHGFVVTAGPRRSASMSRPRHDIVAAADYDKCFAGPPCPPSRAPTHDSHVHVRAPSLRLRRTVEGEYPHPSDSDYKFGDITKARMQCTLPCTCVRWPGLCLQAPR